MRFMHTRARAFISRVAFIGGSTAFFLGCGAPTDESGETFATTADALTEYAPNQAKVNGFYAFDNVINITINLSDDTWRAIKTDVPPTDAEGHTCIRLPVDSSGESPSRFPWRAAGSVTVTDSKGTINTTFSSGVEIRKKSYCGSLTTGENEKPSLKLRIGSQSAVSSLGLQYIDLNNSKQDPSYIRQTLGYWLFGLAGLPHSRANYAKVKIVTPSKTENLVYVNVEPMRSSFIGNPDNGFTNRTITQSGSADAKAPGDLYEFELGDDFASSELQYVGLEKVSAIQSSSKPDLTYATQRIATNTVAGVQDVVNVDQFAKFWAMEVLMKHWDGYTVGGNNTYVYNDVVATSGTQTASTVDFKFIPWGIDQILQPETRPHQRFTISENHSVNRILRNDTTSYNKFIAAVQQIRLNVLSRSMLDGTIKSRIDTLRSQLIGLGLDTTAEIDKVRVQLKVARAAAIMLTGSGSNSFYLADSNTGDVIHASNSETNGIYYEVYHRQPLDDASDRWIPSFISDGSGIYSTLINEAYNRPLYATASIKTALGHYFMFTEPYGNYPPGEDWAQYYDVNNYPNGGFKDFSGTFKLRSNRTGRYAHFSGTDLTPAGRPRVYQGQVDGSDATNIFMY